MPRHTLSSRPLEGEERDQLPVPTNPDAEEWGSALAVLAGAAVLGCALGAAIQVALRAVMQMRFLPFVTTVVLVAWAWRVASAIRRTRREALGRVAQDHAEDAAEVIEVWDPVAVHQYDEKDPAFFLDIGGGRVLVLAGRELEDVPVFRLGRPWPPSDAQEPHRQWEPPFLNTHFVLHRGRRSGRIFRVDALGEPIAAARTFPFGTVKVDDTRLSYLVDGTLATLADDVARAAST